MYNIKNDKRTLRSAVLIRDGLIKCLSVKKISDIGVSDIAVAGGVSRATFYRMFDTPIDVLAYICDCFTLQFSDEMNQAKGVEHAELTRRFLKFWMENGDVIEAIMRSGRLDILQDSFEKHSVRFFPERIDKFSAEEADYIKCAVISILCSILCVWTKHGKKETPEQLLEIFMKLPEFVCTHTGA